MVIRPTCDEEQVSCLFSIFFIILHIYLALGSMGKHKARRAEQHRTQQTAATECSRSKKAKLAVFLLLFSLNIILVVLSQ